jgi:tetratricopeptide (TPR) repeat protein
MKAGVIEAITRRSGPADRMAVAWAKPDRRSRGTMRGVFAVAIAVLTAVASTTAFAQDNAAEKQCRESQATDRIAACTALIDSDRIGGPHLAKLYAFRAKARIDGSDYERALADVDHALRLDSKNQYARGWRLLALVANGESEGAVNAAENLDKSNELYSIGQLVLGVQAFKRKRYPDARKHLAHPPLNDLYRPVTALLTAWAWQGSGDTGAAIRTIDRLKGLPWFETFKDLHAGLILELAGRHSEAGTRFKSAYNADNAALRVAQSYGGWLSRNGDWRKRRKFLQSFIRRFRITPWLSTQSSGQRLVGVCRRWSAR